ncbi:RHS repeat domain-containing protein [Kribbella monticola]|uniref:RHS repeat domain-containing protein n=1 Tax=Kribbella monticola TaxID=2185285 RepID=UPI000DD37500|nr:RHS repeat-associated core domain-containing protein [Kribbella monticola]
MSRAITRAVIGVLSIGLIAGAVKVPAEAAVHRKPPALQKQREASVPVTVVKPSAGLPDHDGDRTVTKATAITWPKPGSAEVALSRPLGFTTSAGTAKAGDLPVKVGPTAAARHFGTATEKAAAAATPTRVKVDLLGRNGSQLRLRLSRTDGQVTAGPVALTVDYSSFAQTYGGDWANRLQLVKVPDCASCAATTLPTRNTGNGELSADVMAGGAPATYALQAAASSAAGDSTATSLSPTATWQVGGSSGDFNWSYPMQVPPSLGGPRPDISLGYSSGSVDGRTTSANSQSSWAGAGFELTPGGSIERRYASCASKSEQSGNNGTKVTGDLCWATDNATFTLNGAGGELVKDDATGVWHPRNDDGTKVEHLYGADNGDGGPDGTGVGGKGEYWVITDKSGTKFYFGKNRLPGSASSDPATNSVWTVPVFGNNAKDATHIDEPCHTASFATSYCDQAYRWNLDYAVDTHGNTMRLYYDVETNKYARNVTATSVSTYTSAGNIARIEYGQRTDQKFTAPAVAKVDFLTANRCYTGSLCTPADYPDTPLDQECTSTSNCNNHFYPTFWTKKRLAKVTTSIWRGTSFQPVNTWSFRQNYLDPQDNSRSPILWLDGITNTGLVGGALATPEMTFSAIMKPNRVIAVGDGLPAFKWPRVQSITYGTGGQLTVGYSDPQCSLPGNVPAAPDANAMLCHPIKWTPKDQAERQDWFHKYLVTEVSESDLASNAVPVRTTVEYEGAPAWRHDDEDGLVEVGQKTWSQWRGFGKVKVTKGAGSPDPQVTENTYFRGMDGDLKADGSTKSVQVTDSAGGTVTDANALSGAVREQSTLDGTTVVDRSITDPWISPTPTATRLNSWGTTKAYKTEEQAVRQDQQVAGGVRKSASENHYSADGVLEWTSDSHNAAVTTDDTCTRYEYTGNAALGIVELPTRKQTVSVGCDKAFSKEQVLSDQKTVYDDGVALGEARETQRLSGFDAAGKEIYQTVSKSQYDPAGRVKSTTNADDKTTTVDYTPATGPVTATVVTQPNGQSSTTTTEPAWGVEKTVVDPAGRQTDTVRDPLGRVLKTFLPGQDRAVPNVENSYAVDQVKPGVVTTKTLNADGGTSLSVQLSDGLLRKRQIQTAAPGGGRMITDHIFDARGLETAEVGPYYNDAPPGPDVVTPVDEKKLPAKKTTEYDDQGRPTVERFFSFGKELWHTMHETTADTETITPPAGEQATTKITDIQGRPIELRQYSGDPATSGYDKTTYAYSPAGQLAKVTDPAGHVWSYEYDVRGRKIKDTDPDKGVTTYTYNDLDQLTSTTDATGSKLSFDYDDAGRKTAEYQGDISDDKLMAEWKYDTIKPGSLTSSTRYVNGAAYTTKYTGYDDAGRPTGTELVVPAVEGALGKTYAVTNTYTPDGQVDTTTLPGVGGLPEETLKTTYDDANLPISLGVDGGETYVRGAAYTPYKETASLAMGRGDNWVLQTFDYEEGTRRVHSTGVETATEQVDQTAYSYDPAGNITKIADTPALSTGQATDNQCFKYDAYRRLTDAWTPGDGDCAATPTAGALGGPAPYWHSWTFDVTGNRKTEKRTSTSGVTTSNYTYLTAKPHALDTVTTTAGGVTKTDKYTYNERGDQKTRSLAGVTDTTTFDAEGHLAEVNGKGKTSYVYDADGERLIRHDPTGTTLYLGSTELFLKAGTTQVTGTRYYSFGDATVAIRTGNSLHWIASDLHGTATLSIDADSLAVDRRRSTPYGEARGAVPTAWPGSRGFVGGTNDDATGLVHLGAREYDPTRGRFISVDPVIDFSDPQQLNGYAYANNNPVNFSDADGKRSVIDVIQETKVVLKTITERIVFYQKEIIKLTIWAEVLNKTAFLAAHYGMHEMADTLWKQVTVLQEVTKKIVQIRNRLVRDVIRITRKIRRYVGPDEAAGLDQLAKSAASLTDSSKGANGLWAQVAALTTFQNASTNWAAAAKLVNTQGGGGGGGGGGGVNFTPDTPSEDLPIKIGFMAVIGTEWAFIGGAAGAGVGAGVGALGGIPGAVVGAFLGAVIGTGGGIAVAGFAYNDSMEPGGFNWFKGASWALAPVPYLAANGIASGLKALGAGPRQPVGPPPVIGPGPRAWGDRQEVLPPPVIAGH